ncbi:RCC1 and BTB domain-containing protein 2 [Dermatophagoides farinae]|uniref:RCC1 and BTB domain-containing protein 2 n=1 Tax=Dermatophagoides farinae TaxID=6954 RepID=UPI003F636FE0
MAKLSSENIDNVLFQDYFKSIDQEFLQSVVSVFTIITTDDYDDTNPKIEFLLMTKNDTYAYGKEICSWLSLKHDPKCAQQISFLNDMQIVQVDSGQKFIAVLTQDGRVYLASNSSIWNKNKTLRLISTRNDEFKMISCGWYHILLLRKDGTLFAMGYNSSGQITGNSSSSTSFTIIVNTGLENVMFMAGGGLHSLAITNTGKIYSWGMNESGELGLGDDKERNTPTLVVFPDDLMDSRIKNIAAGYDYSLFLFENGQLWSCGDNSEGQLGLGDDVMRSRPTIIPIENVQQIACSSFHSFSLAYDGSSYYAWGRTKNGIWTSPTKLDDQPVSFAAASAIILKSPITFGLTSIIRVFGSHNSISYKSIIRLFDNPDNYDVEFIIGEKRILACKCYLKMASQYFNRMFSGDWNENNLVTINAYDYNTYYAYLLMLHNGCIKIDKQNIAELIDLADCYCDQRLVGYCKKFIRSDLDEQTISTYLPLIIKYELNDVHDKLIQITIDQVLPKITDGFLKDDGNSVVKFLQCFYNQQ